MPAQQTRRKSIVLVTTADTDILTADRSVAELNAPNFPQVAAFNPVALSGESARAELLQAVADAGVVVLRLLGGNSSMPEVFDSVVETCHSRGIPLIACPGHQEWDEDLITACSVPVAELETVFSYLMRGGVQNFQNLFLFLSDTYLDTTYGHEAPEPVPWEGIYHPEVHSGIDIDSYIQQRFQPDRPGIGLLFYRAHWMSGNLQFIDDIIRALESQKLNVLPVFSFSLKHNPEEEGEGSRTLTEYMLDADGVPRVDCIVNTMGLAMSDLSQEAATIASGWSVDFLNQMDVPVIQGIVSTGTQKEWLESSLGLSPIDTAMNVALPEFDGRIISVPISFKEETAPSNSGNSGKNGAMVSNRLQRYVAQPDRVDLLARLAAKWAALRRKSNPEKRIAIIMSNYPTKDARIGNAVGLDTPASVINLLNALKNAGYQVEDIPENGDELVHRIIERCSNDRESLTEEQLRLAVGHVSKQQYDSWFQDFPEKVRQELQDSWGDPPGQVYRTGDDLAIAGLQLGNVFVGLQPPRGFGEHPISIYHSPDLTPTHHYIAYYRWIRDVFQADAMVHVGKHGTLEWLPGKGMGLSNTCYPEVALQDLPLFYPFIINNPGEGTQAKRRTHATIIDHLIPPMTTADSYGDIAKLEQLMDEHYQCQTLDPAKLPVLEAQIWEMVQQAELHRDLGIDEVPDDFGGFLLNIDGYLCEIKDVQIKDGLHTLGEPPTDEQLVGLMSALTRLDNGGIPSLRRSIAEALGLDYGLLLDQPSLAMNGNAPDLLQQLDPESPVRSAGDVLERLEILCRKSLSQLQECNFQPDQVPAVVVSVLGKPDAQTERMLDYAAGYIYPALMQTTDEIDNLLRGLDGRFVPAGPSGAPTPGMANVLPTG
ncbi:MAG: cobaltochelatase subunit CobN, partial [Chloroflexi bacterium]|nr:cobaltochelatase subunit CobN [Chloroflexota bacterium]